MDNFKNSLQSLASIKKVDDYGMFQMTYFGDYGFDEFLKVGVKSDEDMNAFVIKHLLTDIDIDFDVAREQFTDVNSYGCMVFNACNPNGDVLLGRNFDMLFYSPSMQVTTRPDNGYTSISTIDLMLVGYNAHNLPNGLNLSSFPTLNAPYTPMDGMNTKGVAVALLEVPESKPPFDENKITLNTTTAVRLVLDKAASVAEAVELLSQYNVYFSQNIRCQYFMADASGRSAVVNYGDEKMTVTEPDKPYQVASNFAVSDHSSSAACTGICRRYDAAMSALDQNAGVLTEQQAVDMLAEVGVIDHGNNGKSLLQWSVVYNLTTLEGVIFADRKKDSLIGFRLTA